MINTRFDVTALGELLELVMDEQLPNDRGMLLEYVKEKGL